MNKKQLKDKLSKKLDELKKKIGEIAGADVEPDDSDMWDSGSLYDLKSYLEEALNLLNAEPDGILELIDYWEEVANDQD